MIPKKIHYCWFGRGEKPANVQKCLASWKRFCPDYQIVEWNEDNFDIDAFRYTKEAYDAKKYAFVSDVARVYALYNYGGIYMDTDVEVLKAFDEILNSGIVLGFEEGDYIATSFMAAEPSQNLFKEFLNSYRNSCFVSSDGTLQTYTNVQKITKMLEEKGLQRNNQLQILTDGITVYPKEYFSPYDYINCLYETTSKSICVHHFYVSWMPWTSRAKKLIKKVLVGVIGKRRLVTIRGVIKYDRD